MNSSEPLRPKPSYLTPPVVGGTLEDVLRAESIHVHDSDLAAAGIRALLRLLGDDPDREGLTDTPASVIRAYRALCTGPDAPDLRAEQFEVESDSLVLVGPVAFLSVCERHLLPFTGDAWVGYRPKDDTGVRLPEVATLVHHYAARPQTQHRLTEQVTTALAEHVDTHGVAVRIKATHTCTSQHGIPPGMSQVTRSVTGAFRERDALDEFLTLAR